jgi:hypothetical protein
MTEVVCLLVYLERGFLESLKSLTFLVGSKRFSEISQGNGYTHYRQTSEDQQGAHCANQELQEFCEHRSQQGEWCTASRSAHMRVHKYPNDTKILTLESLKSLTFLVGSRRFSEISQGNGYTLFGRQGKINRVHMVPA